MILSFKKFDNLLLYLSLKVGVNFMNSQHLRLKWHFEKLDKYGPWARIPKDSKNPFRELLI